MKIACGDGIFACPSGYHTVSAASAQTCLNSNIVYKNVTIFSKILLKNHVFSDTI